MRVLMVSSEVTPFGQTGGLGEVLSALPAELVALGLEVDVLMPKYRGISPENFAVEKLDLEFDVDLNAVRAPAAIWRLKDSRGVRYLFLENDQYYDREGLYGVGDHDYEDNSERFVFLARAAIEMALAARVHYDIFHSHDWQAALIPVYLRTLFAGVDILKYSAAVLTIHNLGYQGIFWRQDMPLVGLGWEFFNPRQMEFHGNLNFLKSGIVFADQINTVSPGYRNEIITQEYGFGLEGVLQEKIDHVSGILNGVDYHVWSPVNDSRIAARFGPDDISGKTVCKADLQAAAGLPIQADVPIFGMVGRFSAQKGIDILETAIPSLMDKNVQVVILGAGDARFQDSFKELTRTYSGKMAVFIGYEPGLAHKIFAGSDMLVVPSRYEPCGLNQLYALKYGSIPIVRATGGLNDTVDEFDAASDSGTGFKFSEQGGWGFEQALVRALNLYRGDPEAWRRLMIRAMNRDFSWGRSAKEYKRLYEQALTNRRGLVDGP